MKSKSRQKCETMLKELSKLLGGSTHPTILADPLDTSAGYLRQIINSMRLSPNYCPPASFIAKMEKSLEKLKKDIQEREEEFLKEQNNPNWNATPEQPKTSCLYQISLTVPEGTWKTTLTTLPTIANLYATAKNDKTLTRQQWLSIAQTIGTLTPHNLPPANYKLQTWLSPNKLLLVKQSNVFQPQTPAPEPPVQHGFNARMTTITNLRPKLTLAHVLPGDFFLYQDTTYLRIGLLEQVFNFSTNTVESISPDTIVIPVKTRIEILQ